jgi:hypothetical protein
MRNTALLLFTSILSLSGHAQGLTNAEVYDFAIGDVFYTEDQWYCNGCYASPLYVRDSIMDEQTGVDGYEVLYTIRTQRYRGLIGPFDAEDTTYVYQFGYVDGTELPLHYIDPSDGSGSDGPYAPNLDTVQPNVQLCERVEWRRHYEPCDTCSVWGPPTPWDSYFVSGCGGPFYLSPVSFGSDIYRNHELIYYRKDGVECGTDLPMGFGRDVVLESPELFPDPVSDVLNWSGVRTHAHVRITSISGAVVRDVQVASAGLDVTGLNPGPYIFCITGNDQVIHRARFVKR